MATRTKIKVEKSKLVEAIRARRKEAQSNYESLKSKSKAEAETYEMRTVDALEQAIAAVKKGKFLTTNSWDKGRKLYNLAIPSRPSLVTGTFDGSRYDRDIQILEMSPEELISISADDFERYVK